MDTWDCLYLHTRDPLVKPLFQQKHYNHVNSQGNETKVIWDLMQENDIVMP